MIHTKTSVQKLVAEFYGIAKNEVFNDEKIKNVCIALTVRHCRIPLGTEQEQKNACLMMFDNQEARMDLESIEQMMCVC